MVAAIVASKYIEGLILLLVNGWNENVMSKTQLAK